MRWRMGTGVRGRGAIRRCFDAEYWLGRAEEVRRHAAIMTDPVARRTMLLVAAGYERLAQHAEERTLRPQPSDAK